MPSSQSGKSSRKKFKCPLCKKYKVESVFLVRTLRGKEYRDRRCRLCINKLERQRHSERDQRENNYVMPFTEIAAALGMSRQAVQNTYHRAIAKVNRYLFMHPDLKESLASWYNDSDS